MRLATGEDALTVNTRDCKGSAAEKRADSLISDFTVITFKTNILKLLVEKILSKFISPVSIFFTVTI